jgi:hypothetical protein
MRGKKALYAEYARPGDVAVAGMPYLLERPVACYDPGQTSALLWFNVLDGSAGLIRAIAPSRERLWCKLSKSIR